MRSKYLSCLFRLMEFCRCVVYVTWVDSKENEKSVRKLVLILDRVLKKVPENGQKFATGIGVQTNGNQDKASKFSR